MSNPAVQLSFSLRTSPNVRTVHLLGSWDHYKSQLPLSALKDSTAKPGSWKGTFRFQGSHALKLGSRYWYYYIIDGYLVSHDPAKEHVLEKTTGRKLNVLDVPGGKSSSTGGRPERPSVRTSEVTGSKRGSREVPTGRALSPGKIQHPKPQKPYASRGLREADYDVSPIEDLEDRFAGTRLSDRGRNYAHSPSELSESSDSSGTLFSSSGSSSPSSNTSESDGPTCRCNRVGVTRDGRRVKLDCGGKVCGYADSSSSSECASNASDEDSEDDRSERARREARARADAQKRKAVSRAVPDSRRSKVEVERRRR